MQKLREKRREQRAMDLVQKDDEAHVKLENAAIERSKAVDSAVLGKYSIWRKENENENSDSTVRLMRDQIIMARVYSLLAKSKNKHDLYQELQIRIKESQRAVGEATVDADLHHRCAACASIIAFFFISVPYIPFHKYATLQCT
jgi:alpha-1,4-galacturonosyltransferase